MVDETAPVKCKKRSITWLYYAIIAVVGLVLSFSEDSALLVPTLLAAAYSTYLFRGGRFVLWIW